MKNQEMRKYELMVIYKPLLPEESKEKIESKLHSIIKKNKLSAEIKETDVWGKRHLAYNIGDYDEGYYIVYRCEFDPSDVAKLEESFRYDNDVIRYMLLSEDEL